MRIIAGKARNLELNVPAGMGVRPTSGRGRKALLDSLGDLEEAAVLDLFAGSGAFALECASRGETSAS
ncbi:MAG: RsmD family RNA methyltransferase [Lentisphaeria bacterium]|nr:RsmD family RNA methyltransferase [Lentisphaeria bacterium]